MDGYFVYALASMKEKRIYVGMSKNPRRRLAEHNSGETKSTKGFRPWRLFFCKYVGKRTLAHELEKKLKSGSGREFLKRKLEHIPV